MAPDDSSAAPSHDGAGPSSATAPGRAQHRLLTALAGLGVAALAAGTFVLTYDDLRALALAGGADRRWVWVHPVLVDVLIGVTVLALIAARNARWWSRWTRWALLLVLIVGAAAAGVQRAVKGYEALPDDALKGGVAVAPYVMLLVVVWLWMAMIRGFRRTAAPKPEPTAAEPEPKPAVPAPSDSDVAEIEAPTGQQLALPAAEEAPAHRTDATWLFDDDVPGYDDEPHDVPVSSYVDEPEPELEPLPPAGPPPLNLPRPTPALDAAETFQDDFPEEFRQEFPGELPGRPGFEPPDSFPGDGLELSAPEHEVDIDDDPTPPTSYPSLLPTDVELVRGRARPEVKPAATTRPDIVMPSGEELRAAVPEPDPTEDGDHAPAVDRAEDPDGGDDDHELAELPPPSGSFRSSPTPPQE